MHPLSYAERAQRCPNAVGKRLFELLETKKTNLALSADVTTASELLHLADTLGPEICLLKTHIDIIEDFTPALVSALQTLAQKHQFLLFEDRKFADIGNTVKHQYAQGIYRIADWADIINAHPLPGPGLIEGLRAAGGSEGKGLLLIAEMSSKGHLMTSAYQAETLRMAEQYKDFVIGFITQHALSTDPTWLNITPGVRREAGSDKLGQQYITPEKAILEQHADIIIAGRGILTADNPMEEAHLYRKLGWEAYLKRLNVEILR